MLLQQEVQIEVQGRTTRPDCWTIALAASGTGKTFTQNVIEEIFGKGVQQFPEAAAAAKFVEWLRDNNHADLEDHAKHVPDTITALNGCLNAPGHKSPDELSNAIRLSKKPRMRTAHVGDLINARKAAAAEAANVVQGTHPFGP